ncbi:stage II sporulation protein R [Aureibacillus halotolerans]|uniref:Stage II sporulation protein R n=1 Tax=Aureibacillus halotolerans TaxID=1508390 RepID=A0A4R6TXW8_9BACI|nr:stage II sporulation protein R [Aureibacillus halotolerans]TDQ38748.1 stage II sporulation protein R [Aureibacillus halotolerans]
MLKKLAIMYILLLSSNTFLFSQASPVQALGETMVETRVIPNEAIRLRILANSDSAADQELKRAIRDQVTDAMTTWVMDLEDIDEARNVVAEKVPAIEQLVQEELKKAGVQQRVEVSYGEAAFPTKMYGQMVYPAGQYEAVVISLGEAKGANWWCVLFPPLCFIDFSGGDAVPAEPESDTQQSDKPSDSGEMKFFIVEWIQGLWGLLTN